MLSTRVGVVPEFGVARVGAAEPVDGGAVLCGTRLDDNKGLPAKSFFFFGGVSLLCVAIKGGCVLHWCCSACRGPR